MVLKAISQSKWAGLLMMLVILAAIVPLQNHHSSKEITQVTTSEHGITKSTSVDRTQDNQAASTQAKAVMANLTTQAWIDKAKATPFLDLDHLAQFPSVEVTATGYYAGKESTGKDPGHPEYGITYSGVQVRRAGYSTIAADPAVFPLGTILWIPDYGYGVVADIGSAIKGHKIDLYFATKDQVYREWGKKQVKVLIIEKGKGKVTEAMFNQLNHPFVKS